MYSSVRAGVKPLLLLAVLALAAAAGTAQVTIDVPDAVCDARLAPLWTPAHPQLGRYEVCTTRQPLDRLIGPGWLVETVAPLDAFGTAGSYDHAAVSRLYGGRRPTVARGWRRQSGHVEAITLVSPHPNRQLTALEEGTLIIRYHVME